MTNVPPFKQGDKVVLLRKRRRSIPMTFKVHIVHYDNRDGWIVLDLHLNKFRASDCVLEDIYNSPLYQALRENY